MVRIAAILLLSLLTCIGSDPRPFTFSDQAFLQAALPSAEIKWSGYPTNIAGCLGWWSADNGWNAAGLTWTNWSTAVTNANVIDLTNTVAGSTPTLSANYVNGHGALYFETDDYLQNDNYRTAVPHEVWIALKKTNYLGSSMIWLDSTNNNQILYDVYGRIYFSAGTERNTPTGLVTNKFYVVTAIHNGSSSVILTNNVQTFVPTTGGTSPANGLLVGKYYTGGSFLRGWIAEIITFTNTLDTATRSNIFSYLTNKYAITVP